MKNANTPDDTRLRHWRMYSNGNDELAFRYQDASNTSRFDVRANGSPLEMTFTGDAAATSWLELDEMHLVTTEVRGSTAGPGDLISVKDGFAFPSGAVEDATPVLDMNAFVATAPTDKKLLWELDHASGTKVRGYVSGYGLEITKNASWDNGTNMWTRDVASVASLIQFSTIYGGGFRHVNRSAGSTATWADTAWDDGTASVNEFEARATGKIVVAEDGLHGAKCVAYGAYRHENDLGTSYSGRIPIPFPVIQDAVPGTLTRVDDDGPTNLTGTGPVGVTVNGFYMNINVNASSTGQWAGHYLVST
jgi:hypothetical protein